MNTNQFKGALLSAGFTSVTVPERQTEQPAKRGRGRPRKTPVIEAAITITPGIIGPVEMTKSCARDLTDRAKEKGNEFLEMLYRLHQGKAWAALGYSSWKTYCEAEFQMTERHSYRLLDFIEVKTCISPSKSTEATDQLVSPKNTDQQIMPTHESQTRPLRSLDTTEQKKEAWKNAVESANGEQPTAKQVKEAAVKVAETKEEDMSNEPDDLHLAMFMIEDWLDKHVPEDQREIIEYLEGFLMDCKLERKL